MSKSSVRKLYYNYSNIYAHKATHGSFINHIKKCTIPACLCAALLSAGCTEPETKSDTPDFPQTKPVDNSPHITKMTPTTAEIGTTITITGENLSTAKEVCFDTTCVPATASSQTVIADVPMGSGNVPVTVKGTDWTLSAGVFSYFIPMVNWCKLRTVTPTVQVNEPVTVYAEIFDDECTPHSGTKCPKIKGQIGYINMDSPTLSNTETWQWTDAHVNANHSDMISSNNDEFTGDLSISQPGSYRAAFRVTKDNIHWKYCDFDSSDNGFSPDQAGRVNVFESKPNVDWCIIQYPKSSTIYEKSIFDIYGQVYKAGCTDNGVECMGLIAQGGFGTDTNVENFIWFDADINYLASDLGNNNEFLLRTKVNETGEYYYAYRFSSDNGKTWDYCDTEGNVPYNKEKLGKLSVIDYENYDSDGCPNFYACDLKFNSSYGKLTLSMEDKSCVSSVECLVLVSAVYGFGLMEYPVPWTYEFTENNNYTYTTYNSVVTPLTYLCSVHKTNGKTVNNACP